MPRELCPRHALELFTWRRFLPWVALKRWRQYRHGACQKCFALTATSMGRCLVQSDDQGESR